MNKKYIGLAVGVLILVLIFVFFFSRKSPQTTQTTDQNQNTQATSTSPTPTSGGKLPYSAAVNTYKYRFQITSCHSNPGSIAVAKNSPVMFDNHDKKSHAIKVGALGSFTVAASDYTVFYPSVKGDYNVTCDGGGSATLHVD